MENGSMLSGLRVVVTTGGSRCGHGIARAVAFAGADVVLVDECGGLDAAVATAADLVAAGRTAKAVEGSLGSRRDAAATIARAVEALGGSLDGFVHSAVSPIAVEARSLVRIASDASGYVTGQTIVANSGSLLL
jgi:NAD(P)-dependent dehydrogenase (short-subunit alcohol dehydrogenase family)